MLDNYCRRCLLISNSNNSNYLPSIALLSLFLVVFFTSTIMAKRPTLTSGKAGGYRMHGSSPSLPSSGIEATRGGAAAGLPFVEYDMVESYLGKIRDYADKKAKVPREIPQETELKKSLVFNEVYDRTSRPVRNDGTTMVVKAGISLYHVLDIDEKLQILSCVIAIRLSWVDEYLQWEPTEWNNISSMLLPSYIIWLPDVVVLNNADIQHNQQDTNVIVSNNGFVLWMFPSLVKIFCGLDLRWFPFDEQKCEMLMSPLAYNLRQINFTTSASNNASYYDEHGQEWTVVSILASRVEVFEPLSEHRVSRLIFRITLKRKALFYLYTCVFPCMLIYFVTLLSFFVPITEQGGKIELPLTSLLSIVVLMMTIADTLAATDTVPLISKMYACTMVQCCTSLVFNAVVTVIGRQKTIRPIPDTLLFFAFPRRYMRRRLKELSKAKIERHRNRNNEDKSHRQRSPTSSSTSSTASSSSSSSSVSSASSVLMAAAKRYYLTAANNNSGGTGGGRGNSCNNLNNNNNNGSNVNYPPGATAVNSGNNNNFGSSYSLPGKNNNNESNTKTLVRIGKFFLYSKNVPVCTQWERVAKRINTLFLVIFLVLTIIGYALCLPWLY